MKVTLNGTTVEVPDGASVQVVNNRVLVDGREVLCVTGTRLDVVIHEGTVRELRADGSVQAQQVSGSVKAGGSVTCGNVGGDVKAGGSVKCGDVTGSIDAGGSVRTGR